MFRCKYYPRLIVLSFVIVLLSLSGLPTQSPQTIALAATDNLIVNAGFEEGNFSPSNPPAGWSTLQYHPGGAQFIWDNTQAHAAGKSVKISATEPDDARWIQVIDIQPHTYYELSGWIRTENVSFDGGGAKLSLESSSDAFLARSETRTGTTDWSYVRTYFDSGSSSQVTVGARLGDYGATATGTAWFDDIRLAVQSLPLNAEFEEGVFSATGSPTDWERDFFAPNVQLKWDDQVAHSGARSVKISAPERNQAAWIQLVAVQPQTVYQISAWIKTENVAHIAGAEDAGANLSILGIQTGLTEALRSQGLFGTNEWTQVQVEFNSGEETQILLELQLGHPLGLTSGTAWFDDLQLTQTNTTNSDVTGDPATGITLRLHANNYQLAQDRDGLDLIQLDGFTRWGLPGDPLLPSTIYAIALPPDVVAGSVKLELSNVLTREIPGRYAIAPAPPYVTSPNGGTLVDWGANAGMVVDGKNGFVYGSDAFFPASPIKLRNESQMRKWRFVGLQFTPVQYNPVTKQLQLVSEVTVHLTFALEGVRSAEVNALLADNLMNSEVTSFFYNFEQAKAWYPLSRVSTTTKPGYVIITVEDIVASSTQLADFVAYKQAAGYEVYIVTETQYDNVTGQAPNGRAEKIRRWLIDNYISQQIEVVLLIGDPNPEDPSHTPDYPEAVSDLVGDVPMKMCWPRRSVTSDSIYWRQSPTDYFYADLTGNWDKDGDQYFCEYGEDGASGGVDFAPEVYVGRIPVYRTRPAWKAELDSILAKMIAYDSASDTEWRNSALLAMAIDHADSAEALRNDYLTPLGFSAYRMYEPDMLPQCINTHDFPVDQPLTEKSVRDYWQAHPLGLVLWAGHGWANGTILCSAENLIHSDDASVLNDAKPAFTYQSSCETGWPEQPTNLGAALLRNGAIGTVSPSRISWSESNIGYQFLSRLARNQPAGMALYLSKGFGLHIGGTNEWQNLFDFNLYGEPTSHLLPPEQWSKLEGTIRGLGYCDVEPRTLAEATLTVQNVAAQSWTLASDTAGKYSLWLEQDGTPYSLLITYPEYAPLGISSIQIAAGETTVVNADLRWQQACNSVLPNSLAKRVVLGQKANETLTITNRGAGIATFEVATNADWLSATPMNGTIVADSKQTLVVSLDASTLSVSQPGDYNAKLTLVTNDPKQPRIEVPVSMTVLVHGVTLAPIDQTRYGDPGATVVYALQVRNTGITSDTYNIVVGGNLWSTNAPATIGPLSPDASTTLTVSVQIPAQALAGATDSASLVVTSQGDASRSARSTLATTANPRYNVSCSAAINGQSGAPSASFVYQIEITNQGNTVDSFDLALSNNQWPLSSPATVGPLNPGQSATVSVTVTIPATVTAGASDTARLTFTSHHDHTKSANVALTTTAQAVYGLTAAPANAVKYASPGETVAYQVQVTNLGNSADSFDVKVAATWPSTAPSTVGPLDPGASLSFDVFVHIPLDPGAVDKDTCRLTISSQSSPDQMSAVQMETFASMSRLFLPIVTHTTNK